MSITFDTMDRYARRFGPHNVDDFERWMRLIEVMDATWLDRVRSRPD